MFFILLNANMQVCSVVPNSLWPHGPGPARLLSPWNFPGKNTGVDCHFLLNANTLHDLSPKWKQHRKAANKNNILSLVLHSTLECSGWIVFSRLYQYQLKEYFQHYIQYSFYPTQKCSEIIHL